jgi:hypothetical protein
MTGKIIPEMELETCERLVGPSSQHNNLFLSVVRTSEGYVGVYRETFFEEHNKFNGTIMSAAFDHEGKCLSRLPLCSGEDPRMFEHNGDRFCWFWEYVPSTKDWRHFVLNYQTGRKTEVTLPITHQGKNWIPVTGKDRLLIVYSLIPLISFWVDPLTGSTEIFTRPSSLFSTFTSWRGGSPARWDGDEIIGYGHQTIDFDRHQPFWFRINPLSGAATFIPLNDDLLQSQGFFVNDPTSLLETNRIVVCSTERRWDKVQKVKHHICRVVMD